MVVLSNEQQEVLNMLTIDFETPKRVSIRRETSLQAVYKIMRKLTKKGFNLHRKQGFKKKRCANIKLNPPPNKKYIRLHGQEWNIKILYKSRYFNELPKNKLLYIDNNPIRVYNDSLEVYSSENLSFIAEDEQRATSQSFNYWNKIFSQIENRLRIIIKKEQYTNISLVKNHYSEVNNELAKDYTEKKVKLRVFCTKDGRLWFELDNSFNLKEAETLHPITAKEDIGKVKTVFNDYRNNPNSYLPSEATGLINALSFNLGEVQFNLIPNLKSLSINLETHVKVLKGIDKSFRRFNKLLESLELKNK